MSAGSSSTWSTQSGSASISNSLPQYSFVQQSDNINASKTRRAVRSHAMKAVRRQQRHEDTRAFRLKWPEQPPSGIQFQLTPPKAQSSSNGRRQTLPQSDSHSLEGTQGKDLVDSIPLLDFLDPAGNLDEYDPFQMGFQQASVSDYMLPSSGTASIYSIERPASSYDANEGADEEVTPTNAKARNLLGAGRVDPFQTFPVRADRAMSKLVDHCMFSSHRINRIPTKRSSVS